MNQNKCVICEKEMSLEETEPEPHNVCVKCFWEEEAKQRNKKYVHRFNLFASWITLDLTITQKNIVEAKEISEEKRP